MGIHSLYGKKRLCYTEVSDYTDYQGIGHDPLYIRYESVFSVVKNLIDEEYQHFLAHPIYSQTEGHIEWYTAIWNETPTRYVHLSEVDKKRYNSIKDKTIKHYRDRLLIANNEDLEILIGALKYIDDEAIYCYDNKVVLVAWGMTPDTRKHKITGAVIHEFAFDKKHKITFDTGDNGSLSSKINHTMNVTEGFKLTPQHLPTVIPNEGYSFDGWEPSPIDHRVEDDIVFKAKYTELPPVEPENINVSFISDDNGSIIGDAYITVKKGDVLTLDQIPVVAPKKGVTFTGWSPSTSMHITEDTLFSANYDSNIHTCSFDAGEHGDLKGESFITKNTGSPIINSDIPLIKPHKGYKFIGWNIDPLSAEINDDIVFTAQYETKPPWYKALWAFIVGGAASLWTWIKGKGCLKWILWILLIAFILFLLGKCTDGCTGKVKTVDTVTTTSGGIIDDNRNPSAPGRVIGDDGKLPYNPEKPNKDNHIIAPIIGGDGERPPIISNPGVPDIIANRLNIYFEDNDVDMNSFILAFKNIYVEDKYKIIGYDEWVKMIQIQIPENERDRIRENLNSQLPDFKFFVVDESIFQSVGNFDKKSFKPGWHLNAVNARQAWQITKGDKNIIVAIVDDGIDASHSMFKDRIVKPYNVFRKDNRLSAGKGHGTHVAGLAVGSIKYIEKGAAGIAPNCKLMPIQVFDNDLCTFSSATSGIMYAIHEGADVVNISIGPSFEGLSEYPLESQKEIARTLFKNQEKVWKKVIQIANKKNCILVFAVGNDKILASIPPENRSVSSVNVGAVDNNLAVANFSNFGEGANISAPGVEIYSAFPENDFLSHSGTSMAAPIVAGTVALMKSIDKDITAQQVVNVLQKTGKKTSGNIPPMIQVDRALKTVQSGDYDYISPINDDEENSNDEINTNPNKENESGNVIKPIDETEINNDKNTGVSDEEVIGDETAPIPIDETAPDSETDYNKIREQIRRLKKRISELEKLLP